MSTQALKTAARAHLLAKGHRVTRRTLGYTMRLIRAGLPTKAAA